MNTQELVSVTIMLALLTHASGAAAGSRSAASEDVRVRLAVGDAVELPGAVRITSGRLVGLVLQQDEISVTVRPAPGADPVRVPRPGTQIIGRVLELDTETLTIEAANGQLPLTVPIGAVRRLQVSDGRGSRIRSALAGIGACVGIFFVTVPLVILAAGNSLDAVVPAGWVGIGAGVGSGVAVAGHVARERWRDTDLVELADRLRSQ
jgi:hypothetical protein